LPGAPVKAQCVTGHTEAGIREGPVNRGGTADIRPLPNLFWQRAFLYVFCRKTQEESMENVCDLFKERGLIAQATDDASIRELLGKEKITFYTGFDPTADSLHVGHFMQLIIMRYMQQAGHRPIVLLGGGTTMVGDPTGKTDMRKMLTQEQIQHNADEI
jgi:hypothetical protein